MLHVTQDAADAIDNMHNSELYGRVLRTNYAQPMKIKGGDKGFSHQAVCALLASCSHVFARLDSPGHLCLHHSATLYDLTTCTQLLSLTRWGMFEPVCA